MPLTDALAKSIAETVAPLIVTAIKPTTDPPVVQPSGDFDPKKNWEKIVEIIVKEVFTKIKQESVIVVDKLIAINVAGTSLNSSTGPVVGSILADPPPAGSPSPQNPTASSVDLRGKIT